MRFVKAAAATMLMQRTHSRAKVKSANPFMPSRVRSSPPCKQSYAAVCFNLLS